MGGGGGTEPPQNFVCREWGGERGYSSPSPLALPPMYNFKWFWSYCIIMIVQNYLKLKETVHVYTVYLEQHYKFRIQIKEQDRVVKDGEN